MTENPIYLKNCTSTYEGKKCYVAKQDRAKKGYGGAGYTRYLVVFADGSTEFVPAGKYNSKAKAIAKQ